MRGSGVDGFIETKAGKCNLCYHLLDMATRDKLYRNCFDKFVLGLTGIEKFPYVLTREEPCRGNTHVYLLTSPHFVRDWIEYFSDYWFQFADEKMSVILTNPDIYYFSGTITVKYDSKQKTYPFGTDRGNLFAHAQATTRMVGRIRGAADETANRLNDTVQRFKIARRNGIAVFRSAYEKLATQDLATCSVCLESIAPKELNVPLCYHLICSTCQPRCHGKCPECRMDYDPTAIYL